MIRAEAHARLTHTAVLMRRPGQTMAEAFELACLKAPELAEPLSHDLDEREGKGLGEDRQASNQKHDDLGQRVRDLVRGPNGKTDPAKLRAFAEANGCWKAKYEGKSLGSQMAGVLGQLRKRIALGDEVVLEGA